MTMSGYQPLSIKTAPCVRSHQGKACGHTILEHMIDEEALGGSYDLAAPQPCAVDGCGCGDFKAFA